VIQRSKNILRVKVGKKEEKKKDKLELIQDVEREKKIVRCRRVVAGSVLSEQEQDQEQS
jgi:hypothetical protein